MFILNFSSKFIDKIILNLKCKRFTPEETIFEVFLLYNFVKKINLFIYVRKGILKRKICIF